MRSADEIVAAGRALAGVRFRPQGRSAELGLDCLGLVAAAAGVDAAGVRRDYALRDFDPDAVGRALNALGFCRVDDQAGHAGDILVAEVAPLRLHAAIATDRGYLHADAGLRRVVEVPGDLPWPLLSAWRTA